MVPVSFNISKVKVQASQASIVHPKLKEQAALVPGMCEIDVLFFSFAVGRSVFQLGLVRFQELFQF